MGGEASSYAKAKGLKVKKIIIFGATGDTGHYLVEECVKNLRTEYEIVAIGKRKENLFSALPVEYRSVDIRYESDFEELPQENIWAVVLLAGILPAHMHSYHPEEYLKTNIMGAFNVLEYCRRCSANRVIYAQTISDVLGGVSQQNPFIKPNAPRNIIMTGDHAVYALSKSFAVDLLEHYHQEYGIGNFVLRLPTIYSYSKSKYWYVNGEQRILAYRKLIDDALAGKKLEIWGDPTAAKDVVYIKDFCQLIRKAILAEELSGGIFNVGTGVGTTNEEFVKGIAEVFSPLGREGVIYCPNKPSAPSYLMDISNCRELLGYEPQYDYISTLQDIKHEMQKAGEI